MKKAESILDPVASADLFEVTAIVQGNGLLGALLYPHVYPYFCCQAIRVHDAKELERLKEQFKGKNLPVYLPQRDGGAAGLLVVQTSGTSPGYSVEITQQNHAEVYEAAQVLFQFAANWCGEHPDIFTSSPIGIPVSSL